MNRTTRFFLRGFSWLALALITVRVRHLPGAHATSVMNDAPVTVLGLGHMGSAMASCLAKFTTVHAWNRSPRPAMEGLLQQVYSTAEEAVLATNLTLVCIDDWEGTVSLLQHLGNANVWTEAQDRTVVVFSTYTPYDIQQLQSSLHIPRLVGGAVVGVPATICSQQAWILVSDPLPSDHPNVFSTLGRQVVLPGSDVGSAALVNLSLVLTITFGIAGHELAHLILQSYNRATDNHGLVDMYSSLAVEICPTFGGLLLPSVSKAMSSNVFSDSYVPAPVMAKLLGKIEKFATKQMHIVGDTFLTAYLVYLEKVTNSNEGPAAWTKHAVAHKRSTSDGEL